MISLLQVDLSNRSVFRMCEIDKRAPNHTTLVSQWSSSFSSSGWLNVW